jgi:hypothetical protein
MDSEEAVILSGEDYTPGLFAGCLPRRRDLFRYLIDGPWLRNRIRESVPEPFVQRGRTRSERGARPA